MPAELAHGDHRRLASRHGAIDAGELGLDPLGKRLDQCLGKPRISGARLPRRQRARDHPDADEEGLLAADDAGAVQRLLIVGRLCQRRADQLAELGGGRHRTEEARIEHGIQEPGSAPDDASEPRRRPHDVGDQPEQAWIGGKQREELHAGRHVGDDLIEGGERKIRVRGAAERIEQRGKKLGQPLARSRAARRGVAAGLPGADGGDRRGRIAEAKAFEARDCRRVLLIGRDHEGGPDARQLGQLLEQGPVMGLDPLELGRAARRRRSRYRQSLRVSPRAPARRARRE